MPGPSLSLVLIDRIPFPRPDDPLLTARQRAVAARGGNGFMAVAASHAALLLAQGAGRLLRRVDDRGVVAVLDSRMATARYGGYLRASLPPFWATTDPRGPDARCNGCAPATGSDDRGRRSPAVTILAANVTSAPSGRRTTAERRRRCVDDTSGVGSPWRAAVLLAGCGATRCRATPVSVFDDPFKVAGHAGHRRPDRPARRTPRSPPARSTDTDGGEIDELAAQSVSDIEEFWETAYGETFDGEFTPVKDADLLGLRRLRRRRSATSDTYGLVNAGFCDDDNTIGWDRGVLLPSLREANGDMAVTMVLAHEYGHAVQQAGRAEQRRARRRWWPSSRPTASPGCTCAGSPRASRRGSRCQHR